MNQRLTRREKREVARQLAKDILRGSSKPWQERSDVILALVLAFFGAALTIALFLIPKTQGTTAVLLTLLLFLLLFPAFFIIRSCGLTRTRLLTGLLIVMVAVVILGWYVWPVADNEPVSDLRVRGIEFLPTVAGGPVQLNVHYENTSTKSHTIESYFWVTVRGPQTRLQEEKTEEELWKTFTSGIKRVQMIPLTVPGSSQEWTTLTGPVLSKDEAANLRAHNGRTTVHFLGLMQYTDSGGKHELDYCGLYQGLPAVYVMCKNHNGPSIPRSLR